MPLLAKQIILPICIVCILFCTQEGNAQKSLVGAYSGTETKRILVLNSDQTFLLINEKSKYTFQLDTLSFGRWHREGDFIVLNTPQYLDNRDLKIDVQEETLIESDSLFIEINNPYEDYYRKIGGNRLFNYNFYIISYKSSWGPEIFMKDNKIALFKSNDDKIVTLLIRIMPSSYLYPSKLAFNYLSTVEYSFKNRDANSIIVNIPDLTLAYIGYERFRTEYVKIKNSNLLLRGEIFLRNY